ncbi:MAG: mechanosensitive ion channel family protein [Sporomusaceae bacterium]|nr:mechanosensitive ion channel family protein [Sporomusaceae bacterium]
MRLRSFTHILLILWTALLLSATAAAQESDAAAVILDGKELFPIQARAGDIWPDERARIVSERLLQLAGDITIPLDSIRLTAAGGSIEIGTPEYLIMTVTEAEATIEQVPLEQLASVRLGIIKTSLSEYRTAHSVKNLVIDLLLAAFCSLLLFWLLRRLKTAAVSLQQLPVEKGIYRYLKSIRGHKLLPPEQIKRGFNNFISLAILLLRLFLLYFYLFVVLSLFPWTKKYAQQLLDYILVFAGMIASAVVGYLPNALIILFIVLFCRYLLKFVRFLFNQIKAGKLKFAGFHNDWADPTYKIFRFLVLAIAAISIFPYIPGSRSLAFQGVSVFLGLLLSFGSSSAVANIIAGIALTYTRAFSIGDRVRIGEHEGDIMEKSLLATRIRTIKNADITIPNSVILNNPIINYSSSAADAGFIINTRVTLAFATPRQQAEELLIRAAQQTPDILTQPAPFVFQTTFRDFSVEYELNAYTQKPNRKDAIYSDLHNNILDLFNAAGVEIMTAHYVAVRDGNSPCRPQPAAKKPPGAADG